MRMYVGVDYHRKYSYLTAMNEAGKIVKVGVVGNQKEAVASFLSSAGCNGSSSAVLEATRNWTVMHDWLEELVDEVHLAHPLKVKAIAEAKIKTDKIDAKVLAHLLRTDLLPEAYVASPEAREVRLVLRQRMFVVRLRTMVKNRMFGMLDRYPELAKSRPTQEVFSQEGRAWLKQIPLKDTDRRLMDEDLMLLEELDGHLKASEALVERLSEGDERVRLLKTIHRYRNPKRRVQARVRRLLHRRRTSLRQSINSCLQVTVFRRLRQAQGIRLLFHLRLNSLTHPPKKPIRVCEATDRHI